MECQHTFDNLKELCTSTPILAYADFAKPFKLHTNASVLGLGAVLYQVHDGVEKVISYANRSLTKSETKYPVHKLEFLCRLTNFLKNRTNISLKDKLLPDFCHGFFWSEENVDLNYFPTYDGVCVLVCL